MYIFAIFDFFVKWICREKKDGGEDLQEDSFLHRVGLPLSTSKSARYTMWISIETWHTVLSVFRTGSFPCKRICIHHEMTKIGFLGCLKTKYVCYLNNIYLNKEYLCFLSTYEKCIRNIE
jgi:hypothetical protein